MTWFGDAVETNVDDFIRTIFNDYSSQSITELLCEYGIVSFASNSFCGTLKRLVFLQGNKNEVYSRDEIDFINSSGDVIVFPGKYLRSKQISIESRIIVTKVTSDDPLLYWIVMTQIINKAMFGFNICFFVTESGILLSIPLFGEKENQTFQLSEPLVCLDEFERLSYDFLFAPDSSDLRSIYLYYKEITQPSVHDTSLDYAERKLKFKRGIDFARIQELRYIENQFNLNLSEEIEEYLAFFDEEPKFVLSFEELVRSITDSCFPIVSNSMNTMQLKFEVELFLEREEHEEPVIHKRASKETRKDLSILDIEDPEEMVKALKKKFGI